MPKVVFLSSGGFKRRSPRVARALIVRQSQPKLSAVRTLSAIIPQRLAALLSVSGRFGAAVFYPAVSSRTTLVGHRWEAEFSDAQRNATDAEIVAFACLCLLQSNGNWLPSLHAL